MTSSVLAICGTHLGDTKLPASTAEWPAADSASISATLASTGTGLASFCRPSRGPTSTSRTRLGWFISASANVRHPSSRTDGCWGGLSGRWALNDRLLEPAGSAENERDGGQREH